MQYLTLTTYKNSMLSKATIGHCERLDYDTVGEYREAKQSLLESHRERLKATHTQGYALTWSSRKCNGYQPV